MPMNTVNATTLASFGLTDEGIKYVLDAQENGPSRKVGAHRKGNLILDVPIRRLGVCLQAESLSGEYLFLVEQELNDGLIALFDQPPAVPLRITDANGRRTRSTYTPDFLIVDSNGVAVKEIKPDTVLDELISKRPHDWVREGSVYVHRPARALFASVGIGYDVLPTSSFNYIRAANYRMLIIADREQPTSSEAKSEELALRIVSAERTIKIGELLQRIQRTDVTPILRLILRGDLFVDVDHVLLSDYANVWISASNSDAECLQRSDQTLHRLVTSGSVVKDELSCPPRHEPEFLRRLAIIDGSAPPSLSRCLRTVQRYRKRLREAQGSASALIPQWRRCGNRDARIGPTHRSFIAQHIRRHRRDPNHWSIAQSYKRYRLAVRELCSQTDQPETPVCRSTYFRMWNTVKCTVKDASSKGGRRLAARVADSHNPAQRSLLATRAFEVAHIDHWKADIHVVVRATPKLTKRPWVTAMVDSYTGEVLATWIAFKSPSRAACSMVIRDCVRRHGRLPEILIADSGAEFRSVHFSAMLASLGITRVERPPEEPRYGKEVERLFKEFKDRYVRGLPGFGLSIHESRAVSSGFQAQHRATLRLADLHSGLQFFIDGYYNLAHKPGSLSSRIALRTDCFTKFPHSGIPVQWDQKFLVATSIEAPAAKYRLWPGRGIQVLGRWHSSPELLSFSGPKKHLTVRLEPYCSPVVYVNAGDSWFVCHCSESLRHSTMSDYDLISKSSEAHDLRKLAQELAEEEDRVLGYALGLLSDREVSPKQVAEPSSEEPAESPPDGPLIRYDDVQESDEEGDA